MQACSRKLHLSPSISLEEFAKLTRGYSGADLQALMYNAHLDAIHAGLNAASGENEDGREESGKKDGDEEIKFVEIGGGGQRGARTGGKEGVRSKAEQAVVNKRVSVNSNSLRVGSVADSRSSIYTA
jgi:peroxin-1